jgi:prevent-host-death family protein
MSLPNTDVGAFDARTRFFELLERIEAGEEVTIVRHGVAVARLVPPKSAGVVESVPAVKRHLRASLPELAVPRAWEASLRGELVR